jgi:hypothetical protein
MRRAALLLFVAAALLVPASAGAGVIVVGKGIRGARLGMTQKQVRAALGKPLAVVHRSNDFGPYTELAYAGLKVTFQGNTAVTAVRTTSASDRTAAGIGVGSTKAQVQAKVPGVHCGGKDLGPRLCQVGQSLPGKLVTAFFFSAAGRITEVLVGVVID